MDDDTPVVRYIHLAEVAGHYSMGIFVFPPHAKIPLHDHPGMCVLSRVLYGDLQRMSLDLLPLAEEASDTAALHYNNPHHHSPLYHNNSNSHPHSPLSFPPGTRKARQKHVDYLQAPDVTVLYPLQGNLHEFRAGPHGAAVLDVLLPPYNSSRDCTFYYATPVAAVVTEAKDSNGSRAGEANSNLDARHHVASNPMDAQPHDATTCEERLYYLIPTGQPEDFHCISGQYRDIGSAG
jgi:hypothetical protein